MVTVALLVYSGAPFRSLSQRVFRTTFFGRPAIVKQRFVKKYRHATLDQRLTTRRLHAVSGGITIKCTLRNSELRMVLCVGDFSLKAVMALFS